MRRDEIPTGAALMTEVGKFGTRRPSLYELRPGERRRGHWSGHTP
ncbi:hypothetical protein OHA91_00975 [Streptomyces erythrochromogenes]|uniref:Uncharacterized protein n=1 Tax=Streptomyces erythrochromogenes TaxID=285574 RepID=A0ABZ1Q4C2_9ACTN|nr:hypothetical protein [Streptomyces erythrochromogenes]